MSNKSGNTSPRKKKQTAPAISSAMIAEQTEAFLKSGGKIERVEKGVTGYQSPMARKSNPPHSGKAQEGSSLAAPTSQSG